MKRALASSPPGALPLRQTGGSMPRSTSLATVRMTSELSAKALAKVETAAIGSPMPSMRTSASPIGTLVSMAMSTRSCRFCFGRVAGRMVGRGVAGVLARADADDEDAAPLRLERGIDERGIDAIGVDEDQQVAVAEAAVGDHDPAIARHALDRHRAQRAVGQQRALVEDGADMHQPAGAEEHLLRREVGMAARPEDMDQPVGRDLVGEPGGGTVERLRSPRRGCGASARVTASK